MIPTLAWVGVTSWKVALGFIKGPYYWQLTFTDADLITLGQHSTNGTRLALAIFDVDQQSDKLGLLVAFGHCWGCCLHSCS